MVSSIPRLYIPVAYLSTPTTTNCSAPSVSEFPFMKDLKPPSLYKIFVLKDFFGEEEEVTGKFIVAISCEGFTTVQTWPFLPVALKP